MIRSKKLAYDGSDQMIYVGDHNAIAPLDGESGYDITKITWDGGLVVEVQYASGTWEDRALYFL